MKKILSYCFVMMIGFVLGGCSWSDTKQNETEKKKADYVIGVEGDNAPYYFIDESGHPSGFYVKLMEKLGEKSGYTFEFVETDAASFRTLAAENNCDVFLGVLEKETGDMTELFQTNSFYQSDLCLGTRSDDSIKSADELRNTEIVAVDAGGEASFAQYLAVKYEADALMFADGKTALEDLVDGNAKAAVIDVNVCQKQMEENVPIKIFKTSGKYHNQHRFTAEGQTEFLSMLETGVAELAAEGTLEMLLESCGLK